MNKNKKTNYIIKIASAQYAIPISVIARNRAEHYAHEFGGIVQRSLEEDTLPLFEADPSEISDWAKNEMDWVDVCDHAVLVDEDDQRVNYQEHWINGDWHFE